MITGIGKSYGSALNTSADEMHEHFEVNSFTFYSLRISVQSVPNQINVVGTLILFQAAYPLLKASTSSPKFIPMSSGGGSITEGTPVPAGLLAYGSSKAALNYLARKLHFEHEELSKRCSVPFTRRLTYACPAGKSASRCTPAQFPLMGVRIFLLCTIEYHYLTIRLYRLVLN